MTLPTIAAESLSPPMPYGASRVLAAFQAGQGDRTKTAYRADLEDFRAFLNQPTPQSAVALLLTGAPGEANSLGLAYRAHLVERGLSPATVNRRLAALRSLVKLARLLGVVTWSLETPNVRSEPYRDTRGPGKDGFRRLLTALGNDDTPRTVRDHAILRLLYDLGLRRGEVVGLNIGDVDLARGTLSVRGKGRREKTLLTLATPTRAALAVWMKARGICPDTAPLFCSFDRARKGDGRLTDNYVYRMVRGLGEQAGIKVAPHGLRHTAITEACKAAQASGIGLEEVLDFSRHRDVRVLMLYRDRERNVQGRLTALVADDV